MSSLSLIKTITHHTISYQRPIALLFIRLSGVVKESGMGHGSWSNFIIDSGDDHYHQIAASGFEHDDLWHICQFTTHYSDWNSLRYLQLDVKSFLGGWQYIDCSKYLVYLLTR